MQMILKNIYILNAGSHVIKPGLPVGTMSEIHANHVLMVNSITELKAHGHPRPSKSKYHTDDPENNLDS